MHVIMTCPKYDKYRTIMMEKLKNIYPFFESLKTEAQFIFIMQCHDWESINILTDMILNITEVIGEVYT